MTEQLTMQFSINMALPYVFDVRQQKMRSLENITVLSSATGGVLSVNEMGPICQIKYLSAQLTKFSIFVCILSDGKVTPFVFRLILRENHVVAVFKSNFSMQCVNGKLVMPRAYLKSTAFILGLETTSSNLRIEFQQANQVVGHVELDWLRTGFVISENIDGAKMCLIEWIESLPPHPRCKCCEGSSHEGVSFL